MKALRTSDDGAPWRLELADALEQQAATAQILGVIARSPADAQPVFEAIVAAGVRLFRGAAVAISRHEGGLVRSLAIAEEDPERAARWRQVFPFPLSPQYIHGAAILERRVVDVADVLETGGQFEAGKRNLAPSGYRAITVVPLMRDGAAIGAIAVVRMRPGALSDKQIALLQTFAAQAVIAIENVRLFNETKQALEHQTATANVLQVISGSMADATLVFEKILDSCEHLFGASDLGIFLVDEQQRLDVGAARGHFAEWAPTTYPRPLAGTMSEMVMRHGGLMHWGDMAEAGDVPDYIRDIVRRRGNMAVASAPLTWDGRGIGTIDVMRRPPRPYNASELALLATFADQAVIAIQNARLFNDTKEALARQTATAEVLRVISGSVTDTQPVFDVIAERAARLTGAKSGWVFTFDGEWIHEGSAYGLTPEGLAAARALFPMRPSGASYTSRAIRDGVVMNVADALAETDPDYATKPVARLAGYRSVLSVPMFRGDQVLGAISVNRAEVGRFGDKEVELLRTFADQALIAIENARLFNESQQALERQTATGEILASMSGSITDTQPVFDTIARNLLRLFGTRFAIVALAVDGRIEIAGIQGEPGFEKLAESYPIVLDDKSHLGRTILSGRASQLAPIIGNPASPPLTEQNARRHGYDAQIAAPMLREGKVIGALVTARREAVPFDDRQTALIMSFADQAVIAIENTRLSNEREARNRDLAEALEQQTATSEILRVIARSPTDVQPVFESIAAAALRLCRANTTNLVTFDGRDLHVAALASAKPGAGAAIHGIFPRPAAHDTITGRAVLARSIVTIEDVFAEPGYGVPEAAVAAGFRSGLGVPLLRDGEPIGAIAVGRAEPGPLPAPLIALMQTFADQAVIAIENVRLFKELQDKTRQLEIANRHKTAFLANMSHELRTPLNAVLGFTRIVQRETRGEIAPKQAENLDKILASARHLVGLINATLDLTRIEAGRIEITPSQVPLAPLLDECLRSVEPLAADGVRLDARLAADLPPLWVDAEKLHQILINLLGNAVKFTETGRIELRAATRDACVAIEVEDSGIGIATDKLEAVFEEFEQVDAGHTRAHGGTGLGLAIARRLARAMGGDLTAVSALGRGSTFTLTLPLRWSDAT